MKRREQSVGYGTGTGHERSKHTDQRSYDEIRALEDIGKRARHYIEHTAVGEGKFSGEISGRDCRADICAACIPIELYHGDAEQQGDCRAGDLLEGILHGRYGFFFCHLMDENGDQRNYNKRHDTCVPEEFEIPADVFKSQDIPDMYDERFIV